jgi:hypothetical protein
MAALTETPSLNTGLKWAAIEKIPVLFATVTGLTFVTGFIVEITFLDRFGLRETGVEFFKAKYLHVGILLLLFSCFVSLPCYAIAYLHFRTRTFAVAVNYVRDSITGLPPFVLNLPMAVLAGNLLVLTYVFAVLGPPRTVLKTKHLLALVVLISVVSPWIALWIAKRRATSEEHLRTLRERLLMFSCLPVLGADILSLRHGMLGMIGDCLYHGGYSFFFFSVLVFFIAHRLSTWSRRMPDANARFAWWAAGACILAATYYLSIISFAYHVYPYIPADKGGGDYTEATLVTIHFQRDAAVPVKMLELSGVASADSKQSKPVIIIEETPTSVYVADPKDAGGPYFWRRGSTPTILQITRSDIATVEYERH